MIEKYGSVAEKIINKKLIKMLKLQEVSENDFSKFENEIMNKWNNDHGSQNSFINDLRSNSGIRSRSKKVSEEIDFNNKRNQNFFNNSLPNTIRGSIKKNESFHDNLKSNNQIRTTTHNSPSRDQPIKLSGTFC